MDGGFFLGRAEMRWCAMAEVHGLGATGMVLRRRYDYDTRFLLFRMLNRNRGSNQARSISFATCIYNPVLGYFFRSASLFLRSPAQNIHSFTILRLYNSNDMVSVKVRSEYGSVDLEAQNLQVHLK